ncbi:BON domain protein [Roseimaritima multifibrata]|uniref:BON domain protein n=1 Tax=Roseimaritima multifibrata TaxID=1930274 RepID=A0A517MAA2_9BACT|nr:BON domain-containing protein [Roseimaritima multifibrata]QDS91771.1 BON domain protein [Roseimaritima multifibrata]
MNALLEIAQLSSHSSSSNAARIRTEVEQELANTNRAPLRHIRCDYRHGILYLMGQVDTYFLKQLAQEHARRVDGVTHIVNNIFVTT